MNHADFEKHSRAVVEAHWRIRAASALVAQTPAQHSGTLRYEGVPSIGTIANILSTETVEGSLQSMRHYLNERLARDLFIALVAHIEARLTSRLAQSGGAQSGTLGQLQRAVQAIVQVPHDQQLDLNEVRERRNALMHHDGHAHDKYVAAAKDVTSRAGGYVGVPQLGDLIVPDGRYLTYAAHVLVQYSAAL